MPHRGKKPAGPNRIPPTRENLMTINPNNANEQDPPHAGRPLLAAAVRGVVAGAARAVVTALIELVEQHTR